MIIPINTQINLIFYSIVAGILTGILFDIYRIIRGFENPDVIITFIEDILFWIFSGILVFIFLLYNGYAYIGFYLYLYITIGLYSYFRLLSKQFLKFQFKVIKIISKFFRIVKNLLVYPIQLMIYNIFNKNK
ncbi:spore cortex biosynthesis protein YabQ [Clostridium aestuarii]|uniref:Spore cortex biosynthesis protein YabQ n=1 Tax=Clostridium aestuarii TaxID=338193 RepID=A0ABT4D398_9CLOT|nr:spore cortex biosynthesis protein YabQ [Clostridium aestuarii]MCY6485715.1 spore cortex biosynthesis protein YabQ [Clostridium aestuarii]